MKYKIVSIARDSKMRVYILEGGSIQEIVSKINKSEIVQSMELIETSITNQYLGSRESCEDKDTWDDFNKALED